MGAMGISGGRQGKGEGKRGRTAMKYRSIRLYCSSSTNHLSGLN